MKKFPKRIGVIHLPPLPGSPRATLSAEKQLHHAREWAIKESLTLSRAGFDGLIIENFGDTPFFKECAPPEVLASMAIIVDSVRKKVSCAIGVNVLRNDARGALAVAGVCGADFIRVNVLCGVYATDQGLIEGNAALLARERKRLAPGIAIFADTHVKHARSLSSPDLETSIEETALRAGADAVIITGSTTGRAVELGDFSKGLSTAKRVGVPLYVGSGVTPENGRVLTGEGAGVIVGSYLRRGGVAGAPLDSHRIKTFVTCLN